MHERLSPARRPPRRRHRGTARRRPRPRLRPSTRTRTITPTTRTRSPTWPRGSRTTSSAVVTSSSTPAGATVTLRVTNTGDRPVQVGSHFHFFEVNRALRFDREAAWGMHLDIPAGTGVRFEPGETQGGRRSSTTPAPVGSSASTAWSTAASTTPRRRRRPRAAGRAWASPTASRSIGSGGADDGDRSRAGSTPTCSARPRGDRVRAGRHQPRHRDRARLAEGPTATRPCSAAARRSATAWRRIPARRTPSGALDLVITNVIVLDPMLGVVKADIGVKDGRIVGDRQGRQPATCMDGVDPRLVIGAGHRGHRRRAPDRHARRRSTPTST